jgi:hypothetical protein
VVAYAPSHKDAAVKLAADLKARGVNATARPEGEVLRKVAYPRVWGPFADVFAPDLNKAEPKGLTVKARLTLSTAKDGTVVVKGPDGKDVSSDWKLPNSVVTVAGEGHVDFTGDREQCYEAGVKLYFDKDRRLTVLNATKKEEKTTEAFRKKWGRPWHRLQTHQGADQLAPQLPEAYTAEGHLILLGASTTSNAVAALQAGELLLYQVDGKCPGPGKALIQFAWSPFAVEKNVVFVGASDAAGLAAGIKRLLELAPKPR